MIANIRQLRSATKEILSAVDRGDIIFITRHGKPCAKIVSLSKESQSPKQNALFGIWRDNKTVRSPKTYVHQLRKNRYAR